MRTEATANMTIGTAKATAQAGTPSRAGTPTTDGRQNSAGNEKLNPRQNQFIKQIKKSLGSGILEQGSGINIPDPQH
jgi:hypothetical protein